MTFKFIHEIIFGKCLNINNNTLDKILQKQSDAANLLNDFFLQFKQFKMTVEQRLEQQAEQLQKVFSEIQGMKSLNGELKTTNEKLRSELEAAGAMNERIEALVTRQEEVINAIDNINPDETTTTTELPVE